MHGGLSTQIQGGKPALGPFRLSKFGMDHVLVGMGPFGRSGGSKYRRGTLILIPVLGLSSLFGVKKKHQSVSFEKPYESRSGSTN